MIDERPGAALDRSLVDRYDAIEAGEREIDGMIARRTAAGRSPEQKEVQKAWEESEKKAEAEQEKRLRGEWCLYHLRRAQALRQTMESLIANHEEQARKYSKNGDAA